MGHLENCAQKVRTSVKKKKKENKKGGFKADYALEVLLMVVERFSRTRDYSLLGAQGWREIPEHKCDVGSAGLATQGKKKNSHWHFSRKSKSNRRQVMPRLGAQHSSVGGDLVRAGWFFRFSISVQACTAAPAQFSFQLSFWVRGEA